MATIKFLQDLLIITDAELTPEMSRTAEALTMQRKCRTTHR